MASLPRALAFWHEILGLPLKVRLDGAAELQSETVLVVLRETQAAVTRGASPAIGWEVEDLEAAASALRARGVIFEEPAAEPGALLGRRLRFRDPDGHPLELVAFD